MKSTEILLQYQNKTTKEQHADKKIILKAFKEFLETEPSELDFGIYLSKIVLFPEMFYYMMRLKR